MGHADQTYLDTGNPRAGVVGRLTERAGGVELRVHHCDPDAAEASARRAGLEVLAPSQDKPHGLREVYLRDGDGYIWVADVPIR